MISRIIDWCAHNRFLVFTGVLLLTLAGIWSLGHIPLDALPDISDVQVIIHTNWEGEPPNIIEDQVTYPIVTALLAAPQVKAVRGTRIRTSVDAQIIANRRARHQSIGQASACQMSRAYSAIVRSLENFPELATFRIAFCAHASGSAYSFVSRWSASK